MVPILCLFSLKAGPKDSLQQLMFSQAFLCSLTLSNGYSFKLNRFLKSPRFFLKVLTLIDIAHSCSRVLCADWEDLKRSLLRSTLKIAESNLPSMEALMAWGWGWGILRCVLSYIKKPIVFKRDVLYWKPFPSCNENDQNWKPWVFFGQTRGVGV